MPAGAVYLGLLGAVVSAAQAGNVSFDRWLAGPPQSQIRWTAGVTAPSLSRHQRLASRVFIRVNGDEVVKRRGKGQLLMMVEIRDQSGTPFHTHHLIDLREPPYSAARNLDYAEYIETAFLIPGDYRIAFALADLATGEHSLERRKLHVAPLAGDPLLNAWRDLPPVEFADPADPPESWFLPLSDTRLALPLETGRAVEVNILMNVSVSETSRAAQRRRSQALGPLVTALKVLSQIDVRNGSLNVSLLDLARRRVSFHQDSVKKLDWGILKTALAPAGLSTIDVGSLENHDREAQFFVGEVARLIGSPTPRVVIVLSAPIAFPAGQDLRPIEAAAGSGDRVFYIRYETIPGRPPSDPPAIYSASRGRTGPAAPSPEIRTAPPYFGLPDQLLQTLKPLHPRTFDVRTPMDFRKALASILHDISISY